MMQASTPEAVHAQKGYTDELRPGTKLLRGQYTIKGFLGSGGFGITYLANDSLERTVVIKECFADAFCRRNDTMVRTKTVAHQSDFKSIVDLFIREARNLSKLQHPNIVGVHQIFEDNDTAYMALDLVEGQDLLDIIEDDNQSLSPGQTQGILRQVLDAVRYIHEKNVLHRDISPDNILLSKTGKPVLIDFGAAREEVTRASRALSALMIVKDGYSPQEFYVTGSEHFPSSDLYALGATFYHLIAGEVPPNSQLRLSAIAGGEADPYVPLSGRFPGYDREFLAAIDKALNIFPKDRIQSALDWIMLIDPEKRQAAAMAEAARDQTIELTISRLVSDTNQILLAEDDTVKDEGVALQKTAPEPAKVVEYLSYDPVVDDIGEPEATGQEDLVEDPVADTEFAAPRPSLIRRIFGALGLWRSA